LYSPLLFGWKEPALHERKLPDGGDVGALLTASRSDDGDPALPKKDAEVPPPQEKNGLGQKVVDALKVHVESEPGDEPVDPQGAHTVARAKPGTGQPNGNQDQEIAKDEILDAVRARENAVPGEKHRWEGGQC